MKKIGNIIKNNLKTITDFVIGIIISGTVVYAAAIASSEVTYTKNNQTNVEGALDDLYTKAGQLTTCNSNLSTCNSNLSTVQSTYIDPSTIQTNSGGKIFASSKGIVIRRNGTTHFIKVNNWAEEQNHIQQVFSGISCNVNSSLVYCGASDFSCRVFSYGEVYCYDESGNSSCSVSSDGSVDCY